MDFIRRILNDDKGFCFHLVKEGNNEDAEPFYDEQMLTVCDGLGGSGNSKHCLEKPLSFQEIKKIVLPEIGEGKEMDTYLMDLFAPLIDNTDVHTSALWGSRIAISRYTYAIKNGIRDEKEIRDFVINGFEHAKKELGFSILMRDGVSMFSTTMASIVVNSETKNEVDVDVYWAGDSRCYCLSANGLQQLSEDHENDAGMTNLFCIDSSINTYVSKKHYIIPKPCILFSCSDGFFDVTQFICEVEEAFIKYISESNSMDEFEITLAELYDAIKGDDCTIALKAFGYKDYEMMKKSLQERYEFIKKYVKNVNNFQEYARYCENPEITQDTIGKMISRFNMKKDAIVDNLANNLNDPFIEPILSDIQCEVVDSKNRARMAIEQKKKDAIKMIYEILRKRENTIDINEIFLESIKNVEKSQKALKDCNEKYVVLNKLFRKMCDLKSCIKDMLSPYNELVTSLPIFFRRKDNLPKPMKDNFKLEDFNFGILSLADNYTKDYFIIEPKMAKEYMNSPLINMCFESGKLSFSKEEFENLYLDAYRIGGDLSKDIRIAEANYIREIDKLFDENKHTQEYLYSILNKEKIALLEPLKDVYRLIDEIDNYREKDIEVQDYKLVIAKLIADGESFLKYYDAFLDKYGLESYTKATDNFNSSLIKSYKLIFDLKKNSEKYASFSKEMEKYDDNYNHYILLG